MRTAALIAATFAVGTLGGCKSLPMGSFDLMNSPAMKVAKLTPPVAVAAEDKAMFLGDRQLVGMSISGGGIRASAFTLGILAGLDEIKNPADNRSALDMVDFASSNSGGSWALAAHLTNQRIKQGFVPSGNYEEYEERFAQLNESRVGEWATAMRDMLGSKIELGHLASVRPRAYFNASILPAQDSFVFTNEFVDAYGIARFYARGSKDAFGPGKDVATLPLGYVAATSGSVPGFTHSYAKTTLCAGSGPTPSFCGPGDPIAHGWIRLVDGGLYDNLAYKTAWQVAREANDSAATRRLVFLLDSKNGWTIPTVGYRDARSHDGIFEAGRKLLFQGSFPLQEATFRRLAPVMFDSIGFRTVLLDFDAASDFDPAKGIKIDDLDAMQRVASDEIDCIEDSGTVLKAKARKRPAGTVPLDWLRERGGDCLANNFARVGYHHKTTYFFDKHYFASTYQLGLLVTRMKEADIRRELGW